MGSPAASSASARLHWEDLNGEAAPAQLRGDFGVQQLGRGPSEHDTNPFRVQNPSHEPRPAGDHLDLVEEQVGTSVSRLRMNPVVRLQQIAQQPGLCRLQAVVLEVRVENVAASAPVGAPHAIPRQ